MTEEQRCRTCLHWEAPTTGLLGDCARIQDDEDEVEPCPLAGISRSHYGSAILWTTAEFGCVLWARNNEKPPAKP